MASDRIGQILDRLERIERLLKRKESRHKRVSEREIREAARLLWVWLRDQDGVASAVAVRSMMGTLGMSRHRSEVRRAMPHSEFLTVARDPKYGGRWSWRYDLLAIRREEMGVAQPNRERIRELMGQAKGEADGLRLKKRGRYIDH